MTYIIWVSIGKNQDALLSERKREHKKEGRREERREEGRETERERQQKSALACLTYEQKS